MSADVQDLIASVIALLVGLTFHEFSHAFVADLLGDPGPRRMGRLTLNPIPHIDPIGALMLIIARFGWAKPVIVNPAALRNGPRDMAIVAAAGPVSNLLVAVVFAVVFRVLDMSDTGGEFIRSVVLLVVAINVLLATFNLLPIPPLDGYNAALAMLPARSAWTLRRYSQYGVFVLLALVLLTYIDSPVDPLGWVFTLASAVARALAGI
jgi:Zn-dependent protease